MAGYRAVAVGSIVLGADLGTAPETTGPLNNDIYHMVKLPKGAVVFGGRFRSSRIASGTSAGSTTMQLNIGLTGAFTTPDGTSYGAATASQSFAVRIRHGLCAVLARHREDGKRRRYFRSAGCFSPPGP